MENNENNVNEKCTGKCKCKILSIIAIAVSVVSIIFSSIALVKGNRRPRDFFGNRPCDMQGCMWGNGFDFNQPNYGPGPEFGGNFGGRHNWNDNNKFGGNRGWNDNNNFGGNHGWNDNNNFGGNRGGRFNGNNNFDNNRGGNFNNQPNQSNNNGSTNNGGPTPAPEVAPPQGNGNQNNPY